MAPPCVSALLKSIEAEDLFQYLQGHRYQCRTEQQFFRHFNRYFHLDHHRFNRKIRSLYLASLDDPGSYRKHRSGRI